MNRYTDVATVGHGRARSIAAPTRKTAMSSYVRPTICTPEGTPFDVNPDGTASTGHGESTLKGVVIIAAYCRSFGPPPSHNVPR